MRTRNKPPAVHDCELQLSYFAEATSMRERGGKLRVVGVKAKISLSEEQISGSKIIHCQLPQHLLIIMQQFCSIRNLRCLVPQYFALNLSRRFECARKLRICKNNGSVRQLSLSEIHVSLLKYCYEEKM